jgi:hypothetical protein
VSGRAGGFVQNQCIGNDPEGDPLTYRIESGPGQINPTTGLWTWYSCTRDTGTFTVTAEIYETAGCGSGPFASFTVHLAPKDTADLNCDGVADVFDLLAQIEYIFNGVALPPCP